VIQMLLEQYGEGNALVGDDEGDIPQAELETKPQESSVRDPLIQDGTSEASNQEKNSSSTLAIEKEEIQTTSSDFQKNDPYISKRRKLTLQLDKIPIKIAPYLAKAKIDFSSSVSNEVSANEGNTNNSNRN
jgi:hypothetical protein